MATTAQPAVKKQRPAAVTPRSAAEHMMERYAELYQMKADITDSFKESVAPLDEEMSQLKGKLQEWSEDNATEFGGKKSLNLPSGTLGYKLGTKAVDFPLEGPENIKEMYFNVVKKELPEAIVESVDSKKVVDAWTFFPNLVKKLTKLGIGMKQADNFYITPKK